MPKKWSLHWSNKHAKCATAFFALILLVPTVFSAFAVAQTGQTIVLPGNGAPILVTPEVHLSSAAPSVGASNATAGNTAGATNATAGTPLMASDLSLVPQYSGGPAYTTTITPMLGVAPSTSVVHLGTPMNQVGATSATAGNMVGATSATNTAVMPTTSTTVPEYNVAGATITIMPPPEAPGSAAGGMAAATPTAAQQALISKGFDSGVGQNSDLLDGGSAPEKSLGEIAREFRSRASARTAAVLKTDGVEQMNIHPTVESAQGRRRTGGRRSSTAGNGLRCRAGGKS